jgi:hypothetical protein
MQEQLTTLNSVTSRHAESCILKWFGYKCDANVSATQRNIFQTRSLNVESASYLPLLHLDF